MNLQHEQFKAAKSIGADCAKNLFSDSENKFMKINIARAKLIRTLPISAKRTCLIKKHCEEAARLKINMSFPFETDIHMMKMRHAEKGKKAMFKYI